MRKSARVQLEHYHGYQIELRDRGKGGWAVLIFSPEGRDPGGETLLSDAPGDLAALLSAARERIDRVLGAGPEVPPAA